MQNGRLKILLNHSVLRAELARLWAEDPDDSFEAAHDYFVHGRVAVVHVADADGVIVKLFTRTHIGGPPLLKLKNRHTSLFKLLIDLIY